MRGKTAEMSQFRPHFHIFFWGGLLCPSPITNPGQICQQAVDPRSTRIRQISFESVYCVTFQGQKTQQFKENFDIWGNSCTQLPLPIRAKFGVLEQIHGIRLHAKFRLDRFILLPFGGENTKNLPFLDFGILWCCQVAVI